MSKYHLIVALLSISVSLAHAQKSPVKAKDNLPAYQAINNESYENAGDFSEGLAPVSIDKKWGFIDKTGKLVIAPQFNPWQAQFNAYFSDGLVAVNTVNGKINGIAGNDPSSARWGFADKSGKLLIPTQFSANYYAPPHFSNGLAMIGSGFIGTTLKTLGLRTRYGYINKTGAYVIEPQFDEATDFNEDIASVRVGDKYGFIDKTGRMVIEPMYDSPAYFNDGVAVVELNKVNFIIDKQNKKVINKSFTGLSAFSDGLARFKENGKVGFIDKQGNVKIKPSFELSSDKTERLAFFSEGLCQMELGKPPAKNPNKSDTDNDAANWISGKFGYINKAGKVVIPAQFDHAGPFKNGIALVSMYNKFGYIDTSGKFIIPPTFTNAGYFIDGIARVQGDGSFGNYKYRFIRLN